MADAMFAEGANGSGAVIVNGAAAAYDASSPRTDPYIYAAGGRLRWSQQSQRRMNDVLTATQLRNVPSPPPPLFANGGPAPAVGVSAFLNSTADTYRAVVEMAKRLNDFCTLTEHQRLGQLRENAPDMSLLHNVAHDQNIHWPDDSVEQLLRTPTSCTRSHRTGVSTAK